MSATTPLDLRLLRAVRQRPTHAYALARDVEDVDKATVYRRVQALQRAGLMQARRVEGGGASKLVLRLTPAGHEALRDELREAVRLILDAHGAEHRGGGAGPPPKPPIVFASGSRISGVEARILRSLGREHPRAVHVVVPPGCDLAPIAGVATTEAPWSALPFRDGYAATLFVNELPPARGLHRAAAEWARVLRASGTAHVIAPAPLPRGVDPFIDFFARLQDELFPDQAGAPEPERVSAALRRTFARVEVSREADQNVWTARGAQRATTA